MSKTEEKGDAGKAPLEPQGDQTYATQDSTQTEIVKAIKSAPSEAKPIHTCQHLCAHHKQMLLRRCAKHREMLECGPKKDEN